MGKKGNEGKKMAKPHQPSSAELCGKSGTEVERV
jgi:hypothetical protein